MSEVVEALAEALASIDGKLRDFKRERAAWAAGPVDRDAPDYTGHYEGYIDEAESTIERLQARGFQIVPL